MTYPAPHSLQTISPQDWKTLRDGTSDKVETSPDHRHRHGDAVNYPRALRSPVIAMARPRRPVAEIAAVQEAAAAIREETGIVSAQGLGREIARRIIDLLLDDTRNDPAALFGATAMDPISTLAFGEGFGAVDELATRYRDRMLANFGIGIAPEFQQVVQRENTANEIKRILSRRFMKHLRLVKT